MAVYVCTTMQSFEWVPPAINSVLELIWVGVGATVVGGLYHPLFSHTLRDLGLAVIGLGRGPGLMKYWSLSHMLWSRGLKSILCSSSVMTSDCIPFSVNTHIWSL